MKLKLLTLCCTALFLQSCTNYEPVAISECKVVVKHAQKLLGDLAPRRSQLMTDCKKATDKERGCVMAATTGGQAARCL
jgi:hypothetical protein